MNGLEKRSTTTTVFMFLGPVCATVLAAMAWNGNSYYLLPAAQRPLNDLHAALRPSGTLGLFYGITGLALIVINLSYLIRSTMVRWEWMGTLRSWMSMHVFTGIIGALFILLHSAFQLRSPMAALAAVSLFIVVVSGIAGRFIYTRVPRSPQGRELERSELEKALKELHQVLSEKGVQVAEDTHGAAASHRGVIKALAAMVSSEREEELEYENLRRAVLASPQMAASAAGILPLARRYIQEKSWLARYQELRELMRAWRFFHRWFSVLLIIFSIVHVLVATNLGGLGLP